MQTIIEMVDQYVAKHGRQPERIVITPYAAVALTLSQGVSTSCNGIPVVSKEFDEADTCQKEGDVSRGLGIFVRENKLRSVDIKSV